MRWQKRSEGAKIGTENLLNLPATLDRLPVLPAAWIMVKQHDERAVFKFLHIYE
jgi:hypothetical protein